MKRNFVTTRQLQQQQRIKSTELNSARKSARLNNLHMSDVAVTMKPIEVKSARKSALIKNQQEGMDGNAEVTSARMSLPIKNPREGENVIPKSARRKLDLHNARDEDFHRDENEKMDENDIEVKRLISEHILFHILFYFLLNFCSTYFANTYYYVCVHYVQDECLPPPPPLPSPVKPITEYELLKALNVQKNNEMLVQFGLPKLVAGMSLSMRDANKKKEKNMRNKVKMILQEFYQRCVVARELIFSGK